MKKITFAALAALSLTCIWAKAQADLVVFQQHNSILAETQSGGEQDSSDSLSSWHGRVHVSGRASHADASLDSTIGADSLVLNGSALASAKGTSLGNLWAYADATNQLQFTVSTTRTYNLVATLNSYSSAIQLRRDGVVIFSGPFTGAVLFEVGHTYEIDGSASSQGRNSASYGLSMN